MRKRHYIARLRPCLKKERVFSAVSAGRRSDQQHRLRTGNLLVLVTHSAVADLQFPAVPYGKGFRPQPEMNDHYMAPISRTTTANNCMRRQMECFKMGIPLKTRTGECPNQYEFARFSGM